MTTPTTTHDLLGEITRLEAGRDIDRAFIRNLANTYVNSKTDWTLRKLVTAARELVASWSGAEPK